MHWPRSSTSAARSALGSRRRGPGRRAHPDLGDAAAEWLRYLELQRRRKKSTLQDAQNTVRRYLLPHFGADTPLYSVERYEVVVIRGAMYAAMLSTTFYAGLRLGEPLDLPWRCI